MNKRNPLSRRNKKATFTGEEVRAFVEGAPTKLAASKKARVVRKAEDFDAGRLARFMRAPITSTAAGSWSIEQIVAARNQQMEGRFRMPARLSEAFGTDGALFTARMVRLAPVQSLSVKLEPAPGPKGEKIAAEAEAHFGDNGIAVSPETDTTIRLHLVDHGIAFGAITSVARPDGSRIDMVMNAWPIEWVQWDPMRGCYVTQVQELDYEPEPGARAFAACTAPMEPIIHGNGRWVIFAKSEINPHRLDAALIPAALIWPRRAFAMRDWTKGSASHGNPKVIGELSEGTASVDELGQPTAEAADMMTLLAAISSQDSPIGIQPTGSKINFLTNTSGAWEVWAKLTEVSERDAARIYLGTDGVLGATGGAPGVDISALFGVATSKIQSDIRCMERAYQTGLISVWTARNFGDDRLAPKRVYVFPDPDESAVRADFAKRNTAFLADMKAYKDLGFVVDATSIASLAEKHGVPVPQLPAADSAAKPSIQLAPTDIARVVSVNEARASAGLGPRPDADGALTVEEFAAKIAAKSEIAVDAAAPAEVPA